MRRLYVGGLSHSITQKDLKDRFGKFGEVEDVELRTRRDDEGVPYKTFGYVNINISEADLKKCLTVLNKSKWKGGTLQIETAKESFLHRLAEERQAAAEQQLQPAAEDKRQKMLESLSKAGVENFNMKAAVPGTEIPGHKDWVVSKFGRVLPVLQLRCQKGSRARTVKYDPSKYSHNIRKLDRGAEDQHTPVTQLTWELQGGDDDISKKRRGEFPPFEPSRPKRSRTDVVNSHNAVGRASSKQTVTSVSHTAAHQVTNGHEQPANHRPAQRRWAVTVSDVDSDEEIRRMVQAQNTSQYALQQDVDEEKLEVVGLDYLVKSGNSRQQQRGGQDDEEENDYDSADTDELLAARKPPPPPPPPPQERLTVPPAEQLPKNNTDKRRNTKKTSKAEEEENDSTDEEDDLTSRKPSSSQQRGDSGKPIKKKMKVLPVVKPPSSESDSDNEDESEDDEDEELESADCSSDSDYEAMFSNVTHLEISFADLKRLAEESQQTTAPSSLGTSSEQEDNLKSAPKKGIMPEEILAALMEDSSGDERKKKKKKRKAVVSTPLPAFQGTSVLNEGSETEECQRRQEEEEEEEEEGGKESKVKKQKLDSKAPQLDQRTTDSKTSRTVGKQKHTETEKTTSESSEEEEEEENVIAPKVLKVVPAKAAVNSEKAATDSSSSSEDEEEVKQTALTAKVAATDEPSSSSSSSEEEEDEQELIPAKDAVKSAPPPAPHRESSSSEETEEEEVKPAPPRVLLGAKEEEELQRKANMRRLAAVQQRQKEAEEHKKLIQGALAKLDAPKPGAGKHIVFGSDDDEDDDDKAENVEKKQSTSEATTKKTLFQDSQSEDDSTDDEASANENKTIKEKVCPKSSVPQLFSGSEDEEDSDEEKDGSRFDIRPQFEGPAGQKLMALQSRFGTDERFRMDSRFLEDDVAEEEESEKKTSVTEEEDALEEERKKNLSILQSVLGSSQQTSSTKTASKAKTFRDVSALHYDPSKEEHAAFETKSEEPKESKSARRKKREEAQKLPEVSKEIYYEVSGDLKAVFSQANQDAAGEEMMNWDQEEEQKEEEKEEEPTPLSSLLTADASAEKETSSGFKFSFFGDDTEPESKETEEYKVESIETPKVSWQQDPRFQDSSSEEDEDEQEEDKEQSSITVKTTEDETPSKTDLFFFFRPEDSRLTEGPRLFCRSSHLEEQREQWEERRSALRQEYRKKHKDARRKLKSSQKS
ncbi:nucleolar protein 8 [Acanthopagrus latus]|uniref:nucleolar protein 8 n=1 Tax=Acanthopagrus latus TaxID=8177 RepID=UPI00187C9042|nr:nucleolar protein 8 [Acanthopagrus latus]